MTSKAAFAIIIIILAAISVSALFVAQTKSNVLTTAPTTTVAYTGSSSGSTTLPPLPNQTGSAAYNSSIASLLRMPSDLPACPASNALFSVSPILLPNITNIMPLGHVHPSDHIFPINHIYLYLTLYANRTAVKADVAAPGNSTVYKIERFVYYTDPSRSSVLRDDYQLSFAPCAGVSGFFYHLSSVSNVLASNFTPPFAYCTNVTGNYTGAEIYQDCGKYVDVKISAGEKLGSAGGAPGGSQALDWVIEDLRAAPLPFANNSRFVNVGQDYSRYVFCPLDYFTAPARSSLYGLLGGIPVNSTETITRRTEPPLCGTSDQDIPGTAQGNWFVANAPSRYNFTESPNMALIHDSVYPQLGVFSIGTSTQAAGIHGGAYYFTPSTSGQVNRDFGNVTSDGKVYCYQTTQQTFSSGSTPATATMIVQLVTPNQLRIEGLSSGSCGNGPWSFTPGYVDFYR